MAQEVKSLDEKMTAYNELKVTHAAFRNYAIDTFLLRLVFWIVFEDCFFRRIILFLFLFTIIISFTALTVDHRFDTTRKWKSI